MIELNEAISRLLSLTSPLPAESVSLSHARGRILAESISADMDDPPFDRSAMDGYCLRSEDVEDAPVTLSVVGEIFAGDALPEREIGAGECMAIMTGAPLPKGANAVQIVENTEAHSDEGKVAILNPVSSSAHIRFQGEVARKGDEVIPLGSRITPEVVGVLAACGRSTVSVYGAPQVCILATGDELVGVDQIPAPGQIRDSNRWLLAALSEGCGATVEMGPLVSDEQEDVEARIAAALHHDVLVFSGGVSMGKRDRVAAALEAAGAEIVFHKVRIKPGKPVLVARKGHCVILGTPGNPVSAAVVGRVFLVPLLRKMMGLNINNRPILQVTLKGVLSETRGRDTFHPARLVFSNGMLEIEPISLLGSADAVHHARGNAWIRRPAHGPSVESGEQVEVWLDVDSLFVGGEGS